MKLRFDHLHKELGEYHLVKKWGGVNGARKQMKEERQVEKG